MHLRGQHDSQNLQQRFPQNGFNRVAGVMEKQRVSCQVQNGYININYMNSKFHGNELNSWRCNDSVSQCGDDCVMTTAFHNLMGIVFRSVVMTVSCGALLSTAHDAQFQ